MTFSTSIDIAASSAQVWSVMVDVERWHEWTMSITRIDKLDPGPLRVGSRARVFQPKLRPNVWEVTELQPGRMFTWVTRTPGLRIAGIHAVEPHAAGARATLTVEMSGILAPLIGRIFRKLNDAYLVMEAAGLKARSEIQVQTLAR
jgi:hypothetical protein